MGKLGIAYQLIVLHALIKHDLIECFNQLKNMTF